MPNSKRVSAKNTDLHVFADESIRAIEFGVVSRGRFVHVHVYRETLNRCFGVGDTPYGLLLAYEAHRSLIDAAVIRRAEEGGTGVVLVHADDLLTDR